MTIDVTFEEKDQDFAVDFGEMQFVGGGGGGIAKETDPTVPAWAKQPQKPTYTAEEVGAQPKGDYVLRDETPEVTGAEVGQTIVVKAVDENGKPTEWECAELPPEWETIVDITTTEEVSHIGITRDINGNPFALEHAVVEISIANSNANNSDKALQIRTNSDTAAAGGTNTNATRMFRAGTGVNHIAMTLSAINRRIHGIITNIGNNGSATSGYYNPNAGGKGFTALYLSGGTFGVGSRVLIKGVRK